MHIPDSLLQGGICPVSAAAGALGVAGAALAAIRSKEKPSASRFGAVAAFVFAAQMINFPVQNGTSGHLLGGVLASALLGIPFGVLAMAIVLLIQCVAFSDGGVSVLGLNIFNMALIGAGAGGLFYKKLPGRAGANSLTETLSLGLAAWFSVMLAALACSLELGISKTVPLAAVTAAMLGVHALIGAGEALITVAVYRSFSVRASIPSRAWATGAPLFAAVIIAALLSPFASGFPDGLEWVIEKYRICRQAAPSFSAPLADYTFPGIRNAFLATGSAGLIGVLMIFGTVSFLNKVLISAKLKTTV